MARLNNLPRQLVLGVLGWTLLTGCPRNESDGLIYRFDQPPQAIYSLWVSFVADPVDPRWTVNVKGTRFFVGNRGPFAAKLNRRGGWVWTTFKGCSELPQGKNIAARYEMYDETNKILQSRSITIGEISNC